MHHYFDRHLLIAVLLSTLLSALRILPSTDFPVARLEYSGNEQLSVRELTRAVTAVPNPFDRNFIDRSSLLIAVQEAERRIEARYIVDGFLFAHVDSTKIELADPVDSAQGYVVLFHIIEGLRYTVGNIRLGGTATLDSSALIAGMQTKVGEPLQQNVLQSDILEILKQYSRAGLPFARVDIARLGLDTIEGEGHIGIVLQVAEGRPARIGRIDIKGNTSTNTDVIIRELRLPLGSLYNPADVERSRSRLERLGYFTRVSAPDLYLLNDSTVALVIDVEEANTSQIDGVLGYNPSRTASESGYISGLLELAFRNISGTGRDAALHYSRENTLSQVLEVRYLEPWLFGFPLNLGVSYNQRQQDSSFTRTYGEASVTLAMKEDLSIAASAGLERVIPTDLPEYPFTAYDSKSFVTGVQGRFDSRDNLTAPHSGIDAVLAASYAIKSIYGPARFLDSATPISLGVQKLALDVAVFQDLYRTRIVGMLSAHGKTVTASQGLLDESDLFRLGGFSSIRGYREAELVASRFGYTNAEVRFMTGRSSFFFGFLDAGILVRDSTKSSPTEQRQYPVSYGLGIQLESPLGLISVSVALPKGEALDQAKLHFGLVKQF